MECKFMKPGNDVLPIDKGLKNTWRLAWIEKARDGEPFGSWCQNLRESGACFCTFCSRKLLNASSGKKVLARHELRLGHTGCN